ncbi:type II toxin-antitoxin system VapC family toxin [uncultured Jannaschia sp.]|uniref:type II toxin-antitoxin system VapC family toxin n=1 Tax=uncultured Jannaschia sp. TaxID=293347 RepID=UPI00260B53E2|nr:type II toxin-antitoxin system VapC family toxin [uncultured Jannaschia sp.]
MLVAIDGALAPSLLWYDLRNILVMATRRGRLPDGKAALAIARLRSLPIETVDMTVSGDSSVIELAGGHRLSAYDATYLALSMRTSAPLATADRALGRAAGQEGIRLLLKQLSLILLLKQ